MTYDLIVNVVKKIFFFVYRLQIEGRIRNFDAQVLPRTLAGHTKHMVNETLLGLKIIFFC